MDKDKLFLLYKDILCSLIVPQHLDDEAFIEFIQGEAFNLARQSLKRFEYEYLQILGEDDLPF